MRPIRPLAFTQARVNYSISLLYKNIFCTTINGRKQIFPDLDIYHTFDLPPSLGIVVRKTNGVPLLSDLCQANYSPTMPISQTSSSVCVRTRKSDKIYLTRVSQQLVNAG